MSLAQSNLRVLLTAAVVALAISGCGGGGDSGTSSNADSNNPPAAGNAAPSIQGQPGSSVSPAQSYSFQPSASDSNGDALSFSASNLPAWASLNASTGRISGTPSAADIGTYGDITITVSDGKATASLGPFSITVTDAASGTATLSWMPPTENSDGTPLTNLAGYEIRYGLDADDLSSTLSLSNPSLSVYVVENLASGTWYFAVLAVNASGVTSSLSNVASKTIG
jgi:hypothetical protein